MSGMPAAGIPGLKRQALTRAKEAGLKYMAVVLSDNIITQLSLQSFEKVNKGSYTVLSHYDREAAKEWLIEQS